MFFVQLFEDYARILRRSQILDTSNFWIHKGMLPRFLADIHMHVARSFVFCVMFCGSLFVLLIIDYHQREEHLSASSNVRRFDFNSSFGITATTDGSCETSLELPCRKFQMQRRNWKRIWDQPVYVSEGARLFLFFFFCLSVLKACPFPVHSHSLTPTFLSTSKAWRSPL